MTNYFFEAKKTHQKNKRKQKKYQKSDMFCGFANPSAVCRVKDSCIVLSSSAPHLSQCVVLVDGTEETWAHTDLLPRS